MVVKKSTKNKKEEKAAIADIFGSKAAVAPEPVATKKKDKDRPKIEMSEEFESYVAIKLLKKAIEGAEKQLDKQFKDREAFEYFHQELVRTGSQPASFDGINNKATAQFQLKKRSAGFSGDIADQLGKLDIAFEKTEKIPERFTINPQLLEDQELLGKLAVAIKKMGVDYDVIQKQKPVYSYQISKETAAQVSKIKDNTIRAEIVRNIFSIAVAQPKIDTEKDALEEALEILQENGILGEV